MQAAPPVTKLHVTSILLRRFTVLPQATCKVLASRRQHSAADSSNYSVRFSTTGRQRRPYTAEVLRYPFSTHKPESHSSPSRPDYSGAGFHPASLSPRSLHLAATRAATRDHLHRCHRSCPSLFQVHCCHHQQPSYRDGHCSSGSACAAPPPGMRHRHHCHPPRQVRAPQRGARHEKAATVRRAPSRRCWTQPPEGTCSEG